MTRHHSKEDIRRFDLMKLGVLLLLIALLILTWFITRDGATPGLAEGDAEATPAGVTGTAYPEGEESVGVADLPAPTLAVPSVDAPAGPLPPGDVALSGVAGAGAQVIILVNGARAAAAIAGVDGRWAATANLPVGDYVVQAQVVDNVGSVVSESAPLNLSISDSAVAGAATELSAPEFDSLTGNYVFSGMAAPGDTVTITANGTAVGSATADEAGNWTIAVPGNAAVGDIQMNVVDASGNTTAQSVPLKLGGQPPSLSPPGELLMDPETGAASVPVQPGPFTWVGQAEPGASVELLVNGQSAGLATVDAAGQWSLPVELPEGSYTVQLNLLDPSGNLLIAAAPFTVVAGAATGDVTEGATPAPEATSAAEAPAAEDRTIADVLRRRAEFSTLLSVLDTAGLTETLADQGPYTVFAPTNDAFAGLPQRVIDGLNANPQLLLEVLRYHVTRGRYLATDLMVVQPATLNGRLLTILTQGDTMTVNDAVITSADNAVENGVIHAIDRILVPPLATGVRPPIIDESGVPVFVGPSLTIVGTAEPNRTILVELNGEAFGQPATVGPDGTWLVSGEVGPGEYQIVAYMLGAADALEAISRPVVLQVR